MDPMGCMYMLTRIQCEAPKISKLVQITPITMVYGTYNQLVTGAFVNQLITGGHIVAIFLRLVNH